MSEFMTPKATFEDQLRFTPYAWAKLLWMRDRGDTEVAGYGITGTEDPLLVTDFILVKQECTGASFEFDPDDSVDYMNRMLDVGLPPWAYSNILIHTHPGNSPDPSGTDEKNFIKAFSHPHWAIMFILAKGGNAYCRLKINVGPGVVKEISVAIEWKHPFCGTDIQAWEKEYGERVMELKVLVTRKKWGAFRVKDSSPVSENEDPDDPLWWNTEYGRWITQQEEFDHQIGKENEEHSPVDEIDCYWNTDGNVAYWNDEDSVWFYYDPLRERWYSDDPTWDGTGDDLAEIPQPNEDWALQVVLWANRYADERQLNLVV